MIHAIHSNSCRASCGGVYVCDLCARPCGHCYGAHDQYADLCDFCATHCAACGRAAEGEYSLHRDGFSEGPQVPLCNFCGGEEEPTLGLLWQLFKRNGERGVWTARATEAGQ